MDDRQREQIRKLRAQGYGARKISEKLGISENTIKSFIKRNGIKAPGAEKICPVCGKPLLVTPGKRKKWFCSDRCRMYWHNHHPSENKGGKRLFICARCGKEFYAYAERKYCSHPCYIKDRFGGRHEREE
jgi:endogenous inhibitor of DNA gyrase (YacG/DUF329 family)